MGDTFSDRLQQILADRQISQRRLADILLVSPGSISGWLRGAARPYDRIVDRICTKLGLRREWLTIGEGEPYPPGYTPTAEGDRRFAQLLDDLSERAALFEQIEQHYEALIADADQRSATYRDQLRQFRIQFRRAGENRAKKTLTAESRHTRFDKKYLPSSTTPANATPMRVPNLNELLKDIRSMTENPGARKALADSIGVSQQQLSHWLSLQRGSGYSPSAVNALKLLQWVAGQRKANPKKGSEDARTPSEQATQRRSSKHETNTSGQEKSSHSRPARSTPSRRSSAKKS